MIDDGKLYQALKRYFNFDEFRPGQKKVMKSLFQNQNTFAIMPTGSGKTLLYQLYGLMVRQPILVVSPLLALMSDQVSRMQYLGFKNVAAINSLVSNEERYHILRNLNHYQFIFISPEMISMPNVLKYIKRIYWGLFVIDEAHCISQWGHDFRPEYLDLGRIRKLLNQPKLLLLTATASINTQKDILSILNIVPKQINIINYSMDRKNIFLAVEKVNNDKEKDERLLQIVAHLKSPGIIYFSSRKIANQIARLISEECHLKTAAFHSGLNNDEKYKIQHQFMNDQLDLICATSAFGMGIDKNDIRYVIHYHLSSDLESYVQEMGRAGRDGKQSVAIILYRNGDEMIPLNLVVNSLATPEEIKIAYRHPNIMAKLIHQDDEKARIINFYWHRKINENELIQKFEQLATLKQYNLTRMKEYVQTNQCRRRLVLKYFNDRMVEHNEKCCNGLGTALSLSKLNLFVDHHHVDQIEKNWDKKLKQLFNQ